MEYFNIVEKTFEGQQSGKRQFQQEPVSNTFNKFTSNSILSQTDHQKLNHLSRLTYLKSKFNTQQVVNDNLFFEQDNQKSSLVTGKRSGQIFTNKKNVKDSYSYLSVNNENVDISNTQSVDSNYRTRVQSKRNIQQFRSYQLDAVRLIFNRLQKHLTTPFEEIRQIAQVNKNVLTDEFNEFTPVNESLILEKNVFLNNIRQSSFNGSKQESESTKRSYNQDYNSNQTMEPQLDHIYQIQHSLDKLQESINFQNSEIKQPIQDSQGINGFKVSFANLRQQDFELLQRKPDIEQNSLREKLNALKQTLDCQSSMYFGKRNSLTVISDEKECRPLKFSKQKKQRNNQQINISKDNSTEYYQMEKTVTSFECNLSSLKESPFDSNGSKNLKDKSDLSQKYCSFTAILQNQIQIEEEQDMDNQLQTNQSEVQNASLAELLYDDQSVHCSFSLPQYDRQSRILTTMSQFMGALQNSRKRILSQTLQQLNVYGLKQDLIHMNQRFNIMRQEVLRRVLTQRVKFDRIIKKVCFTQWQNKVENYRINIYVIGNVINIFEIKLKSFFDQIKQRSKAKQAITKLFVLNKTIRIGLQALINNDRKYLGFELIDKLFTNSKLKLSRQVIKQLIGVSNVSKSYQQQMKAFQQMICWLTRYYQQQPFQRIQWKSQTHKIKLDINIIAIKEIDSLLQINLKSQAFRVLKRLNCKNENVQSITKQQTYCKILVLTLNNLLTKRTLNAFIKVISQSNKTNTTVESLKQSLVTSLKDSCQVTLFEQYKANLLE